MITPGKQTAIAAEDRALSRPPRLSEELAGLIESFAERSVCLREVLEVLRGRAYTLLLFFLALPFCTPIPLPGISTPFGLVIAIIGFRLSLGQKPWLPRRLLETKLPPRFFSVLFNAGRRLVKGLEYVARPRHTYLVERSVFHYLYGAIIFLCGLLMLLPLPIPFSNGFPALTVVCLAAAILEKDGYLVIAGVGMFIATCLFFSLLLLGGAEAVAWIKGLIL